MAFRLPRITVSAEYGEDVGLGEVSMLSLGYGLHQAWIYSALFGTASVFCVSIGTDGLSSSPVFTYSIGVYAVCLLLFGVFDQKVLLYLVNRKVAIAAAVLMLVGTLVIPFCEPATPFGAVLCAFSGLATGLGSAVLIEFWGTAFARTYNGSIVLNTALALFVAMMVYAIILHLVPAPASGILAALLPCIEIFLLWGQTPQSYIERHKVPIFNPLPLNRGRFIVLIALPMLLFGLSLGYIREYSATAMMPNLDLVSQMPLLLAAGIAMVVVVLAGMLLLDDDRPDSMLRPLLPLVAIALFLTPLAAERATAAMSIAVIAGYLCFEGVMWILLCAMAQRYRISPVMIVGIGRGALAVGALAGLLVANDVEHLAEATPYGPSALAFVLLVLLVTAFSLVPHERDIRRAVTSGGRNTSMLPDNASASKAVQEDETASVPTESTTNMQKEEPARPDADTASEGEMSAARAAMLSSNEPDAEPANETEQPHRGLFRQKCERIADRYLLSNREAEVLFFLAKGHNAAYLQEKLFISEGTAKTHIRHIYGKTNVHNQQELMRLVSEEWID